MVNPVLHVVTRPLTLVSLVLIALIVWCSPWSRPLRLPCRLQASPFDVVVLSPVVGRVVDPVVGPVVGPVGVLWCLTLRRDLSPCPLRKQQTLLRHLPILLLWNLQIPRITLLRNLWLREMIMIALLHPTTVPPRTLPECTLTRPAGLLRTSRPCGLSTTWVTVRCVCLLFDRIPIPPLTLLLWNRNVFRTLCRWAWTLFIVIWLSALHIANLLLTRLLRPRVQQLTPMPVLSCIEFLAGASRLTSTCVSAAPFLLPCFISVTPLFPLTTKPVLSKIRPALNDTLVLPTLVMTRFEWGVGGNPTPSAERLLLLTLSCLSCLSRPTCDRIRPDPAGPQWNPLTNLLAPLTTCRRPLQVVTRRVWCLVCSMMHPEQEIPQLAIPFSDNLIAWPAMPLRKVWLRETSSIVLPQPPRHLLSYRTDLTLRRPAGLLSRKTEGWCSSSPVSLTCTC